VIHEDAADDFYAALLDDDPEALYDRAPCGYLSTMPDGVIVKVNSTFLTWTGFTRDELVGRRSFSDLLTVGGRIYHETHYAPMLHMEGRVREIALDLVCADGRRLPVLVNSVMERSDDAPKVIRTVVFDATHRREYERELVRAKERAEESEERMRLLARTLQQTLIPHEPPTIPGLDVAAAYRPALDGTSVGGDFYDVFEIADDDWIVSVGDVCGKGADAAVVTALARYTIRAGAVRHRGNAGVLDTVNDVLLRDSSDRFVTSTLVRLRCAGGRWSASISCAGHPPPVLARGGEARFARVTGDLLGVKYAPSFGESVEELAPGDVMVLYTDGVTEARRPSGEFFGEERLLEVVRRSAGPAAVTVDAVVDAVLGHQDGVPRDDIVVVAVRAEGP
jgi:phosphoserine phosphatase RsbU/P